MRPDDAGVQARRCLEIIAAALVEAGADLATVVRTRVYLTDPTDANAVGAEHGQAFGAVRPAAAMIVVAGLLNPRWKVEIEAGSFAARLVDDRPDHPSRARLQPDGVPQSGRVAILSDLMRELPAADDDETGRLKGKAC